MRKKMRKHESCTGPAELSEVQQGLSLKFFHVEARTKKDLRSESGPL